MQVSEDVQSCEDGESQEMNKARWKENLKIFDIAIIAHWQQWQ